MQLFTHGISHTVICLTTHPELSLMLLNCFFDQIDSERRNVDHHYQWDPLHNLRYKLETCNEIMHYVLLYELKICFNIS